MKVTLNFLGGTQALFGNVVSRDVDLPQAMAEDSTDDVKATTPDANTTDDVKATTPDANATDEGKSRVWTLKTLLVWLKESSGLLTGEESLFFNEEHGVRNGILVNVNGCDWELLGEQYYEVAEGDTVVFHSTLHGG